MRSLPSGWELDGEPHYVDNSDDGCASYWRVWVKTKDGRVVTCGCAASPQAAKEAAVMNALKVYDFE